MPGSPVPVWPNQNLKELSTTPRVDQCGAKDLNSIARHTLEKGHQACSSPIRVHIREYTSPAPLPTQ